MITVRFCAFFIVSLLSACRFGAPSELVLSFSAYTERPVVLTEMTVNGQRLTQVPAVIRGRADSGAARVGSNRQILSYPPGDRDIVQIEATWVELPDGTAYSGTASVGVDSIAHGSQVRAMLILAPGGMLVIASDPSNGEARDVMTLCANRTPEADVDYRADPGQLPALREAMAAAHQKRAASHCGGNEND